MPAISSDSADPSIAVLGSGGGIPLPRSKDSTNPAMDLVVGDGVEVPDQAVRDANFNSADTALKNMDPMVTSAKDLNTTTAAAVEA